MPITITCLNCGKTAKFPPSQVKKFCSKECKSAYYRVQKICVICSQPFENVASRAKEQVTCRSEECIQTFKAKGEYRHNYGERRYTFTCLHCEKPFTSSFKSRKYCSKACRHDHSHTRKICVICGQPFEVGNYHAPELVTCRSKECKRAIKLGEHNYFYGKHHTEASIAKAREKKLTPRKEVDCTCGCGEKVLVTRWRAKRSKTNVFFVDPVHMRKWLVGENHWNYRGGNIYYGDGWDKVAQAVRERDKVCQYCGKTPEQNGRALDVHHIIPARISRDNSMNNLVALCMSCHHGINVLEQYEFPIKVNKYRKCLACEKVFIPEPFQKFCSDECKRKRKRQWEKKHRDTHPTYNHNRRQRIKQWQQKNKHRVNAGHQRSRLRKRVQPQAGPGLFDLLD